MSLPPYWFKRARVVQANAQNPSPQVVVDTSLLCSSIHTHTAMLLTALFVLTLASLASTAVPHGYTQYRGVGHYKLYSTPKSFGAAWKTCKDEGSNLVVVNSLREVNAVRALYAASPKERDGAWIGVHDMFFEDDWVTVLGYPLPMAGYAKWRTREPNNANGNENCVAIHRDGLFNDENCSKTLPFVCEA